MLFQMTHKTFLTVQRFLDANAPSWLTSANTVPGSTMDNRWFFERRVLTLGVGKSVETDFHVITRIH